MHELPVVQSILDIVLRHAVKNQVRKIHSVSLGIGMLSDLEDDWVQKYFDYCSKGTVAEGAKLKIERIPVVFQCKACPESFQVDMQEMQDIACPACGGTDLTLVSGREYYIKNMEAE
jgi:hydrogenase nickel incorporation protein HypA/HybF